MSPTSTACPRRGSKGRRKYPRARNGAGRSRRRELIEGVRLERGMLLSDVARDLGMTLQGVRQILRRDRTPRPPTLAKLRDWLAKHGKRVSIHDLLD